MSVIQLCLNQLSFHYASHSKRLLWMHASHLLPPYITYVMNFPGILMSTCRQTNLPSSNWITHDRGPVTLVTVPAIHLGAQVLQQKNYSELEKEGLAIILVSKCFTITTMVDSSPLSQTINLYHFCLVSPKEPHWWHLLEFRDGHSPWAPTTTVSATKLEVLWAMQTPSVDCQWQPRQITYQETSYI